MFSDVLQRGGPFMWVILAASLVGLAVLIERVYVLWFRYRLDAETFFSRITGYLDERSRNRALELCEAAGSHPLALVLKAGLLNANEADLDIKRAMEAATIRAVPRISKRINYLSVIANVATLLGLLGTILGLIVTFEGVGQADAAMKQEILSKGIGVAMFTTAAGLMVAIPAMIGFAVLQNRQNAMLTDIQATATELFNYLSASNRRARSA